MFIWKDKKGKMFVEEGNINMLKPEEALGKINLEDIEEIYEVGRVWKPKHSIKLDVVAGTVPPKQTRNRTKKAPAEVPADVPVE